MLKVFLGIMLFQLGGLILPGPDFAIVFRYGVVKGKKDGVMCVSGVTLGVMINLLITFLIGTTLYNKYHLLYIGFISCGVIFLYYISISLIRNFFVLKRQQHQPSPNIDTAKLKNNSFVAGLLTNLSNAKAIVFFSALMPLVNQLDAKFIVFIWLSMALMTWGWFYLVVVMFTHDKVRQTFLSRLPIIELIIGCAIFTFASIIAYGSIFKYVYCYNIGSIVSGFITSYREIF